jgi:hypothetical protein
MKAMLIALYWMVYALRCNSATAESVTHAQCHHELNRGMLNMSFIQTDRIGSSRPGSKLSEVICKPGDGSYRSDSLQDAIDEKQRKKQQPRFAHCIAGSARTLWSPKAHETIQHNFIEALGGYYNTFMYIYSEDTKAVYAKFNDGSPPVSVGILRSAIDVLQPTKLVIAPEKPMDTYSSVVAGCSVYNGQKSNILGQVDTLRDVFSLVEEYEAEHHMRFDWVTRIRPDLIVLQPVTPWCFLDTQYYYVPRRLWMDHIGIFSREVHAETFFHIIDNYFGCKKKLNWGAGKTDKPDIQQYFNNIPPMKDHRKTLDIAVMLLRSDKKDNDEMCGKFTEAQPWVFGSIGIKSPTDLGTLGDGKVVDSFIRGASVHEMCMRATWVGPTPSPLTREQEAIEEANVDARYEIQPASFHAGKPTIYKYSKDCELLFKTNLNLS